jgi:hypothetical protein
MDENFGPLESKDLVSMGFEDDSKNSKRFES